MNAAQQAMYFSEFGKLREVLRTRGKSNAEIEAHRHAITVRALGAAKSSKDFTNGDLDLVLARIRAELSPADLDGQMALQESPHKARVEIDRRIDQALQILVPAGNSSQFTSLKRLRYVEGAAIRICRGKQLHELTNAELAKVMGALERSARIRSKQAAAAQADKVGDDDRVPF